MTDNIFNKPITGEINNFTRGTPEQADPALLVAVIDAVLAFPEVEAIRWDQYTPYFNDGDPCEFSIYEVRVKLVGIDDDDGDYGDGFADYFALTFEKDGKRPYAPEGVEISDELGAAIKAVNGAVAGGQHYTVLHKLFGDPAQVTATPEGFHVEDYEHD